MNWFNIEYLEIPAKGGKHGFFILAGYWFYHPWILCDYVIKLVMKEPKEKNLIWYICGTGVWGAVSVLLVPWLFGRLQGREKGMSVEQGGIVLANK